MQFVVVVVAITQNSAAVDILKVSNMITFVYLQYFERKQKKQSL